MLPFRKPWICVLCFVFLLLGTAASLPAQNAAPYAAAATLTGHDGAVTAVAFSPTTELISGDSARTVKAWYVNYGPNSEWRSQPDHPGPITGLAFNPDGLLLYVASGSPQLIVHDYQEVQPDPPALVSQDDSFNAVTVSPNGSLIAAGGRRGVITLWRGYDRQPAGTLAGPAAEIKSLAFDYTSSLLIAGHTDGSVNVWFPGAQMFLRNLSEQKTAVLAVAISPDMAWYAAAGEDNAIRLWNTEDRTELYTLTGHTGAITSLAFSPDGRWMASGSRDKTIKLWDMDTGQEAATLTGHTAEVNCVAFSSDGVWLASGSSDKTVRLWKRAE